MIVNDDDLARSRAEVRQMAKERDTLAEALGAVLDLADRWDRDGLTQRGFPRMIALGSVVEQLRAVAAAPLKAGPDIAAKLEAYGQLARLRSEVEAAQSARDDEVQARSVYGLGVPEGAFHRAREAAEKLPTVGQWPGAEPLTVTQAAREIARTFSGWDPSSAAITAHSVTAAAFERFADLLEDK